MKSGTFVGIGIGVLTVVAGVSAYLLQSSYYERVEGVTSVEIGGAPFAVEDYVGLDNDALPLRLRGCFRLADPEAAVAAGAPLQEPEVFNAPGWFSCWDAEAIDADLRAGLATAIVAETTTGDYPRERIIAVYPDGRAFMWRRLVEDG